MTGVALACAGLVHDELDTAESGGSEVLFEELDGAAAVTYGTRYSGSATDFGWLIPVPGEVLAVEDGDPAVFDTLRAMSSPWVEYPSSDEDGSGGCGCAGGALKGDGANSTQEGGVTVLAEGFTGSYDYVVLAAGDSGALAGWLTEHGWSAASAQADLDVYLSEGQPIVALRVLPQVAVDAKLGSLPPVRIRYDGPYAYPLRMSRGATEPEQALTVYVRGPAGAGISGGWSADDGSVLETDADPLLAWEDHLRELAGAGRWQWTWSGAQSDQWVTRFDAVIPSVAAATDPEFSIGPDSQGHSFTIVTSQDAPDTAWLLPVLGLGVLARRRRR